jgi:hypothetical protein
MSNSQKIGLVFGGVCRTVIPTALAHSLKEGHKIVFHDLQTGKVDALPLVGCLFVAEEDLPNWAGFDQIRRPTPQGGADTRPEGGGE